MITLNHIRSLTYLSDKRGEIAMVHYLREHLVDKATLVLDDEGSSRVRPLENVFELRFLHLS
jgi:hypothetical protein